MEDAEGLLSSKSFDSIEEDEVIQNVQQPKQFSCLFRRCPILPLASSIAALGGILFGYDIGIISGAMLQLRVDFWLTCAKQEMIVTSLLIGGLLASVVGGQLVDYLGRRMAIIVNSLIFIVGALVLAAAHSYTVLVFGRLLLGFAVSLSAIGECIYISEIAPPSRRGFLVSLNELGITLGILLAYLVGYLCIEQEHGWRLMFGLSCIFGVLQAIGMLFLPPSPRWLISKGRQDQAENVILWLWPGTNAKSEVERLKVSMNSEQRYKTLDLFRSVENLRFRMVVGCGLVFFQQVTGQPTVLYYAPAVFQSLGFTTGPSSTLATVGLGTVKVVCTLVGILLVDKVGRRGFLLFGGVSMTSSLIILSVITQPLQHVPIKSSCSKLVISGHHTVIPHEQKTDMKFVCKNKTVDANKHYQSFIDCSDGMTNRYNLSHVNSFVNNSHVDYKRKQRYFTDGSKYVCLVSLMTFIAGYAVGYGPVSWLLLTEIFPVEVKGRAVAIATVFNWGTNILISSTFLEIMEAIGPSWLFALYAIIGSLAVLFIYHFVPETKRRSLEQISTSLKEREFSCPEVALCCRNHILVTAENYNNSVIRGIIQEDSV